LNPAVYLPRFYRVPPRLADVPTAWGPNESILMDMIQRFDIPTKKALEFGVDYGYSASALANYFEEVIGVDHFQSDRQTGDRENLYEQASRALQEFPNVHLVCQDYREFIKSNDDTYGLIHVDMFHDYECTYGAGRWAADHAKVVIFHDTEGWVEVKNAVGKISEETGMQFYNYAVNFGLGILVRQ